MLRGAEHIRNASNIWSRDRIIGVSDWCYDGRLPLFFRPCRIIPQPDPKPLQTALTFLVVWILAISEVCFRLFCEDPTSSRHALDHKRNHMSVCACVASMPIDACLKGIFWDCNVIGKLPFWRFMTTWNDHHSTSISTMNSDFKYGCLSLSIKQIFPPFFFFRAFDLKQKMSHQ